MNRWQRFPGRVTLLYAALFLLALLPRLAALGRYITPDELTWVYRSILFREALLDQRWADTLTAGHPGVITTWLGAAAISLQMAMQPASRAAYEWATHLAWLAPDNAAAFEQLALFLSSGRLAVALVNSLGVLLLAGLVDRLFGRPVAVLAGLLLALDPFLAGLSGLLHVDGLMTTFSALSLLCLALWRKETLAGRAARWLVPAGALAALAILSKSPALLLLPLTGLFMLTTWPRLPARGWPGRVGRLLKLGGWWLLGFVPPLLLLPALWVNPAGVLTQAGGNANRHIEEALRPTFFLGEVAYNHGPAFYPVALAFRLSPVIFAGLLLAGLLALLNVRQRHRPGWSALLLLAWCGLFLLGISLAAKKFDRYALPLLPPLILLAALAWTRFQALVLARRGSSPAGTGRAFGAGALLLVALQGLGLLRAWPYPLAAYNGLLGGPTVAAQVLTVGWGEAEGPAGRWLAAQPGAETALAVTDGLPSLAPFYPGRAQLRTADSQPQARYIVLTASSRQLDPAGAEAIAAQATLVHTVHYAGLAQAWVYAQEPVAVPGPALAALAPPLTFGGEIVLQAAGLAATPDAVHLALRWGVAGPVTRQHTLKLTVRDAAGQVWGGLETPLLNEVYFYPADWLVGEQPEMKYTLALPPGVPPAGYTVEVALFDAATGEQLGLRRPDGTLAGVVYPAGPVAVPPPPEPTPAGAVALGVADDQRWLDGALVLLGHAPLPETIIAGAALPLRLAWHTPTGLAEDLTLRLALGDAPALVAPLSPYPTGRWRAGETIQGQYSLPVPPALPAGDYAVTLAPCATCAPYVLGQVTVLATDRLFALPDDVGLPLAYTFTGRGGEEMVLRGAALATPAVEPGDAVRLTLYWQTTAQPADLYTVFVHLVGPDGTIVAQGDQWPGGLPSNTWAAGQVVVDGYVIELPAEAPAGVYQVVVGLYTAADGVRLAVVNPAGEAVPDDKVFLALALVVGD